VFQTIGFPAGGRQVDAKATFLRYEKSLVPGADESVRIRADGNDLGLFLPGDSVEIHQAAERWNVTPVDPTTTGVLRLGMGRVTSSRVALAGTVNVHSIDPPPSSGGGYVAPLLPREFTAQGNQYTVAVDVVANASLPGMLTIGLNNPGGKTLVVHGIAFASMAAGYMQVGRSTTFGSVAVPTVPAPFNKLGGGAPSTWCFSNSTAPTSTMTTVHFGASFVSMDVLIPSATAGLISVPLPRPIVIPNGVGMLCINGRLSNRDFSAQIDFEEI
jgi:hypothetical protein